MAEKIEEAKPVYLMIRDIGHGDNVGIEWGVEWSLEEGEELPDDVEDLSEARYTAWCFIKVLQGIGDEDFHAELKRQRQDRPSGLIVPASKSQN